MTPLSITTLLDLPLLRITLEETEQFTVAAGLIPADGEVALIAGYHALILTIGRRD